MCFICCRCGVSDVSSVVVEVMIVTCPQLLQCDVSDLSSVVIGVTLVMCSQL